ncbi:Aquaporin [Dictyocoela muelleri]|nr:Aquaporin [Dictyocoela muelleri]
MENRKRMQSLFAEMMASFLFGFVVYSAIISKTLQDINAGSLMIGMVLALSATAIIYTFCDVSPAHFNPAITFAAILLKKMPPLIGIFYIIFQLIGFLIAAAVVLFCFPGDTEKLLNMILAGPVSNDVTDSELIAIEMILTGILVYIAFAVAIDKYKPGENEEFVDRTMMEPLVIGFTIGFLGFLGGSTSGGFFNPGLVFGAAFFNWDWSDSWKYFLAEISGGFVGGAIHSWLLKKMRE